MTSIWEILFGKKKKPELFKRDKEGRRVYDSEFNGEDIKIKSLSRGLEDKLIRKYKIIELTAQHELHLSKTGAEGLSEDELIKAENLYFQAYAMLERAAFACGQEMCRNSVQQPKEWFDDLSREEWALLITTMKAVLNRWPIPQMYMELHHDLLGYFGVNKTNSKFTGKRVSELMEMRRAEYQSGDVKKNNCERALLNVRLNHAKTVPTT